MEKAYGEEGEEMILFYSGSMTGPSQPERALRATGPGVMLTYWEIYGAKMNETLRRLKRNKKRRKQACQSK